MTGSARQQSARARLAVGGQNPDVAAGLLAEARLWPLDADGAPDLSSTAGIDELAWRLLDVCVLVASPEAALRVLCEIAADHPEAFEDLVSEPQWLGRVAAVAGTSGPLGRMLAQHPSALRSLERPIAVSAEAIAEVVQVAATQAASQVGSGPDKQAERTEAQARAVATIRRHLTASIAGRDLTGLAGVDEVAFDLANLAAGVLEGTLAAVHHQLAEDAPAARIAVIGMGKVGGQELNYISDVDVVFVHEATGTGPDADVAAAAEATRVLTAVLAILNASTTMGRAYEIDPTLRPEGRHGALSRSLEGFEAYWDRWAKTWEFQALLKARALAGDRALGDRFVAAARKHVWPESLDPAVIGEIRRMKVRVEAKPEVRRDGDRQLKLGPGGLRDIEFAVQLLQLVHGRHDRRLHITGTLPALTALANGGYIADEDASAFSDAYRQLRQIEHRLQLAHERRTHTIPEGDEAMEWLARSLGHRATPQEPARIAFQRQLKSVQGTVRDLHAKLFYRPLLEVQAAVPASDGQLSIPGQVSAMGIEDAQERLRALGFIDGHAALGHIGAITAGVSRRARAIRAILPAMLHRLANSPDPDVGLRMLRKVIDGHGPTAPLTSRLRDHPPAADLLAQVLGTSEVAGELFAAQPSSAEWLIDEAVRTTERTREDIERLLAGRLGWQDRDAALRRVKRQELLRVVLRDLGGWTDRDGVSRELTALGEACLEVGLQAVIRDVLFDMELEEAPATIAIVGMGKLGGHELHYCSDLDVLFLHDAVEGADSVAANAFALRVAERVVRSLGAITKEGTAFEVDADLRPEGRSGPLSRSLLAYQKYYGGWSDPWEHQALLRARPVAGDPDLGRRFSESVVPLAVPERMDLATLSKLRQLKARLERERIPRRADPTRHLKMGPGGLADVEWTVQLLQMAHGAAQPTILTSSTTEAIDRLAAVGLLDASEAAVLADGYGFLTDVRNRLYLRRAPSVDELPRAGPDGTEALARAMGYAKGEWQSFEEDHARHRRRIRAVCEEHFYGIEPHEAASEPPLPRQDPTS